MDSTSLTKVGLGNGVRTLAVLTEHGPLTMVALSRRIGTTAHNVTKRVDWLELEALVERRKDEHDRRAVTLHVTSKGHDTERRLAQAHMEAVAEALTDLPDADLHELTDLLDRLRMAMRQRLS